MALQTENFGLIKPQLTDPADITAFNENWDKIDEQLLKAGESGGSDLVQTEESLEIEGEEPILDPVAEQAVTKIVNDKVTPHIENTSNPHEVTASQVGLGNVPNVTTNDQTPTYTMASSLTKLTSGEKLSVAFGNIAKAINDLISHIGNKSNPHGVTASQVGALTSGDVVDNLVSTATNLPLSANQGNVLNKKFDEKAPVDHQHKVIQDIGDGRATTFAYSKEEFKSPDFLAVWNGSELRGIHKSNVNDLIGALPKSGGTILGQINTDNSIAVTPDGSAFSSAPIVFNAYTAEGGATRSGCGFHNQGVNGAFMYLNTDGAMRYILNSGLDVKLITSNDFTVSGDTLILNWL